MKLNEFDKHFEINGKIEQELWGTAMFLFDTSAILEIYYYSEQARKEIFSTSFKALKKRLWLTSHSNYEYFKNRSLVIKKSFSEKYDRLKSEQLAPIKKSIISIENTIATVKQKTKNAQVHPFVKQNIFQGIDKKIDALKVEFEAFEIEFDKEVKDRENELKKLQNADDICENVLTSFQTTDEYDFIKIMEIIDKALIRFTNKIPPGYKDYKEKQGIQKFGDLIIWNQIIDFSIKNNCPIIFITNDLKEDWWEIGDEKNKGRPKDDLIVEFRLKTKNQYWSYSFSDFLHKVKQILKVDIPDKTLKEVEKVSSEILEEKEKYLSYFNFWKDNKTGFYRFELRDNYGSLLLQSNGFITKLDCLNTINFLKRVSPNEYNISKVRSAGSGHFFIVKAPNGESLGRSDIYTTASARDYGLSIFKIRVTDATIAEIYPLGSFNDPVTKDE